MIEEMDEWDKALAGISEQGSPVWIDARVGRFTSSEIYKLMKSGSRLMSEAELRERPKTGKGSKSKYIEDPNLLSDETITYIRKKVAEILTGEATGKVYSHATAWGEEMEPYAAEFFQKRFKCELEICSFKAVGDHAGGSPDRLWKGTNEIVEFKCPYDSANQVGYLSLVDQWDLKRENPEYYWQCMANIHFWSADFCHFATYDHRMKDDSHKLSYLKIHPVAEDIDLIDSKIVAAVKEKLELLKQLTPKLEIPI